MSEYVHPEVLVDSQWVADHLNDPKVRIIEADEDVLLYEVGHIPGAVKLDWHVDVQNPVSRDFIDQEGFEKLLGGTGALTTIQPSSFMATATTGMPLTRTGCSAFMA